MLITQSPSNPAKQSNGNTFGRFIAILLSLSWNSGFFVCRYCTTNRTVFAESRGIEGRGRKSYGNGGSGTPSLGLGSDFLVDRVGGGCEGRTVADHCEHL